MKILSLEIRNVMCFGNMTQKLSFTDLSDNNNSTMNILLGKNGSGKSSLINCLKLGLYFDKVPINVSEISNDINGNGYIKVELESFNSTWSIESNYTKTSLKSIIITKDNEVIDTGKIPETKKYVYERILDIEYHIFSNIISLSMNDFKSFIAMSAKDTRLIRDRIFGFYVLNEMNEQNKINIKKYVDKLTENTVKKDFIEGEIEKLKLSLDNDEKISELEQEITRLEQENIEKTKLSNIKINSIEDCKKESDISVKYIEYFNNETVKSNILLCKKELDKIDKNIKTLEDSENKNSEKINNILQDIQTYYKKNSLKQYNEYNELLLKLQNESNEKSGKISAIRDEYNKMVINQLYCDFNNIIDKTIDDFNNIKEVRNNYVREIDIKNTLTTQYSDLKDLRDNEQKSYSEKSEQIKKNKEFIKLYESGTCPTCETSFTSPDYQTKIAELIESNEKLDKELIILEESIKGKDEAMLKVGNDIDSSKRKAIEYKLNLKSNFNPLEELDNNLSFNAIEQSLIISLTHQYKLILSYLDTENIVEFGNDVDVLKGIKIDVKPIENIAVKKIELDNLNKELQETESKQKLYQGEIDKFDKTKSTEINQLKYLSAELNENNISSIENELKELKEKSVSQLILSESQRKISIKKDIETYESNLVLDELQFKHCIDKFDSVENAQAKYDELELLSTKLLEENELLIKEMSNNNQTISNNKLIISNNKDLMKGKLEEYNKQIDEIVKEYTTTNNILTFLKIIEYSLSDKGIKSYIIGKLIPYMNQSVNYILNQFDLPLAIKFDDEFKPAIYRFGNEVSFRTISLGQSKMIDYSIICTIIKFIKNKCTNLNVVFLDEIFSSLHVSMLPIILEITKKEIVENLNMDVFLVNHSMISPTFFDKKLEMIVDNNFSKLKISDIKSDEKGKEDIEL